MSVAIIGDYGITFDEPENFIIGEIYLNFYKSGWLNFGDDALNIDKRFIFKVSEISQAPHQYWPFANTLSALTKQIFYQNLHLLGEVESYHMMMIIITSLFIFFLYGILLKHWGKWVSLFSVLTLITLPRFFGEIFNNVKDIPQVIFASSAIILLSESYITKRVSYFYWGCVLVAMAIATKIDGLLIFPIVGLWLLPEMTKLVKEGKILKRSTIVTLTKGLILIILLTLFFFPTSFYSTTRFDFLIDMLNYAYKIGTLKGYGVNFYAQGYWLWTTPTLVIIAGVLGFIWIYKHGRRDALANLMWIWFIFVIFRQSLPQTNHYDGIRHFLIALVPFSIIAGLGLKYLSQQISLRFETISGLLINIAVLIVFIVPNILNLVWLHPYQNIYFNFLIGGLGGAQHKNIPYSGDNWLNSYRSAMKWLAVNASSNAEYWAYPYGDLAEISNLRKDLKLVRISNIVKYKTDKPLYVVIVPREWWPGMIYRPVDSLVSYLHKHKKIYSESRQGGEIFSIYLVDGNED